jgi:hypothetical protein
MRFLPKAILALALIGIALFALPWIAVNFIPEACNAIGGKYASAWNRCVTRGCYASHSCGIWTHPELWRDRVKRGDDIATVVFWLGQPGRIDGDTYYWWTWGANNGPHPIVTVTFHNGRLAALGPGVGPEKP